MLDNTPTTWHEALNALRRVELDIDVTVTLDAGGYIWRAGDILLRNGSALADATAILLVTEVYPDGLRTMGYIVHRNRVEIKSDWRMSAAFINACAVPPNGNYRAAVRKL